MKIQNPFSAEILIDSKTYILFIIRSCVQNSQIWKNGAKIYDEKTVVQQISDISRTKNNKNKR